MTDRAADFAGRIQAILPGLVIHSAVYNDMGSINDVVIVNDELVFRFVRPEGDYGILALADELRVLAAVRPHVPLAVPDPFYISADAVAYKLLPGETLSRDLYLSLPAATQQDLADQIAGFLRALHTAPFAASLPATRAPVRRDEWLARRPEIEAALFPLFQAYQIAWVTDLFDGMLADPRQFDYEPCLINGDIAPYHLLYDRGAGRLTGVIDWGMAGVGDPAADLGWLLQIYGGVLVRRLLRGYPAARGLLPRARFYTQALELEWAMRGLAGAGKRNFWFIAHLAGARDLVDDDLGWKELVHEGHEGTRRRKMGGAPR